MGKRKYRGCRDEAGEREKERGKERKEEDRGERRGGGGRFEKVHSTMWSIMPVSRVRVSLKKEQKTQDFAVWGKFVLEKSKYCQLQNRPCTFVHVQQL